MQGCLTFCVWTSQNIPMTSDSQMGEGTHPFSLPRQKQADSEPQSS